MKRAIGIIRVSATKDREGERFASPVEQRERIERACEREGLRLLDVFEELDVSGGRRLDDRPGLLRAVQAIESGQADVVAAAYFDRLFRSLTTQAEVVDRVERASGQVLAIDTGRVTNGSAAQWLSGIMLGGVSEYLRRSVRERTADAQRRAVDRGVPPWPRVTPGYLKDEDGRYIPDPVKAPIIREAFRMRAAGATVREVHAFLADNGIRRTYGAVMRILQSRVYLGEIHFGSLVNLTAHEPIVDRDTFRHVQRLVVAKGRHAKSQRLLARLGVLRCGTCGSRMVLSTTQHGRYSLYRCSPASGDCQQRVTISADVAENIVADATKRALAHVEGRASAEENARRAAEEAEHAQAALDAAVRAFQQADIADESSAVEKLSELRGTRDRARERAEHLGAHRAVLSISAARDWDRLTLDEQRGLIRSVVDRVTVAPGRGPERVSVQLLGE